MIDLKDEKDYLLHIKWYSTFVNAAPSFMNNSESLMSEIFWTRLSISQLSAVIFGMVLEHIQHISLVFLGRFLFTFKNKTFRLF